MQIDPNRLRAVLTRHRRATADARDLRARLREAKLAVISILERLSPSDPAVSTLPHNLPQAAIDQLQRELAAARRTVADLDAQQLIAEQEVEASSVLSRAARDHCAAIGYPIPEEFQ